MSFFGSTPNANQSMFGSTMGSTMGTGMGSSMGSSLGGNTGLFGAANTGSAFGATAGINLGANLGANNPNKDFEVTSPPEDSISGLAFSPAALQQNFLVSGSWDNQIRCWEVSQGSGGSWQTIPKAQQSHTGPVLDVRFSDVSFVAFVSKCNAVINLFIIYLFRTEPKFSLPPVIRR